MTIQTIIKTLEETKANFVLLLCHQQSDPDALCSAFAFQGLLKRLVPRLVVEIGAGQGISKLSKHMLQHTTITVNPKPSVESADVVVLLDTNTVQQLGDLADAVEKSKAPLIVVDHHAPHPDTLEKAKLAITREEASSTCEVVYDLFKQLDLKPSLEEAQALFLGIAFDSRHFALANASTLKTISELCDLGVNPQETLALLVLPMDYSERVARMKACRRAKLIKIGDWIIALSRVSAYEASAARALVDLGAHAAAVAGKRDESIEISFRCTREFTKETGIHLGKDIAKPVGEQLHGMGGGHAAAAGANGTGETEAALKLCLNLFREKLSKPE
jgi:nanoRNase/pAp phosphatase (c-di-AMP/oligoRNAs hydrolase)